MLVISKLRIKFNLEWSIAFIVIAGLHQYSLVIQNINVAKKCWVFILLYGKIPFLCVLGNFLWWFSIIKRALSGVGMNCDESI